ncbi:MAG: hypothetical protein WCX71_00370 [Candidatus Buchananbacteria bacterium]
MSANPSCGPEVEVDFGAGLVSVGEGWLGMRVLLVPSDPANLQLVKFGDAQALCGLTHQDSGLAVFDTRPTSLSVYKAWQSAMDNVPAELSVARKAVDGLKMAVDNGVVGIEEMLATAEAKADELNKIHEASQAGYQMALTDSINAAAAVQIYRQKNGILVVGLTQCRVDGNISLALQGSMVNFPTGEGNYCLIETERTGCVFVSMDREARCFSILVPTGFHRGQHISANAEYMLVSEPRTICQFIAVKVGRDLFAVNYTFLTKTDWEGLQRFAATKAAKPKPVVQAPAPAISGSGFGQLGEALHAALKSANAVPEAIHVPAQELPQGTEVQEVEAVHHDEVAIEQPDTTIAKQALEEVKPGQAVVAKRSKKQRANVGRG